MLEKFSNIKALVFDIDGVLSDGRVFLLPDGTQVRNMNIKDGYALQLAVKKGYFVGIISGGKSLEAKIRLEGLGITDIHLGVVDKLDVLKELMYGWGLTPEALLYMGDDIPDYEAMRFVGAACAPKNAVEEIKQIASYISPHLGGEACVRDVIEKVMKIQGTWFEHSAESLDSFKW